MVILSVVKESVVKDFEEPEGPDDGDEDDDREPGIKQTKQSEGTNGNPARGAEPDSKKCGGDKGRCDGDQQFTPP